MTLPQENVDLETLIASAPQDVDGRVAVMQQVLRTVLVMPSGVAFERMDQSAPVLVPGDGFQCVAVFTSAEAARMVEDKARYALTVPGASLITQLAPDMGLAVAAPHGMVVFDPHLLGKVRADLATR